MTLRFVNNRVVGNPMEPRVAIGDWDEAAQKHTLISPTQGAVKLQNGLTDIVFKVPKAPVHVIPADTGGVIALRGKVFPEPVRVTRAPTVRHSVEVGKRRARREKPGGRP